jgi:hypothetical protein
MMAEWACHGTAGPRPGRAVEAVTPTHAGPDWTPASGLSDLVAYRPGPPVPWLVEATSLLRLGGPDLRKGAHHLSRLGLMAGRHVRVLCGERVEHRVLLTLDVEAVDLDGGAPLPGGPPNPDRTGCVPRPVPAYGSHGPDRRLRAANSTSRGRTCRSPSE